ncbi:hypothetical protein OAK43_04660, partial [Verrucomicrobiales bacterium]|nr:hypothetical protein [Verrucomicrobiales bacterium]
MSFTDFSVSLFLLNRKVVLAPTGSLYHAVSEPCDFSKSRHNDGVSFLIFDEKFAVFPIFDLSFNFFIRFRRSASGVGSDR